jgi:hypothetical protein
MHYCCLFFFSFPSLSLSLNDFLFQKENTIFTSNWIAWKQIIISSPFNYHFHHQIEQQDSIQPLDFHVKEKRSAIFIKFDYQAFAMSSY